MARYRFSIENSEAFNDEGGRNFVSAQEAIAYGVDLARELSRKDELNGSFLIIADEHGSELARLQIWTGR